MERPVRELGLAATLVLLPACGLFVFALARATGRDFASAALQSLGTAGVLFLIGSAEERLFHLAGYPQYEASALAWAWPMTLTCLLALEWINRRYLRWTCGPV